MPLLTDYDIHAHNSLSIIIVNGTNNSLTRNLCVYRYFIFVINYNFTLYLII